ncbi:hypothetical protein [Oceanobacillus sp. Castelsardo]|uniref:hypothetical protein n=1 Tax=Oceanobacillus sp. Castelsardo TaxID=1851204 RepID=UPI0012E79D7C|nr:hypothetical protein [Oceanobacillus sp. Castelsardo]
MNVKTKEDQASELRSLLDGMENEKKWKKEDPQKAIIDVLNLPPRKEFHTNKSRARFKIDNHLIRLIIVVIIAALLIGAYYFIGENIF